MFNNFRLSMTWVHTWFGLVLGFVLMICFFFGALSVFDREIDRWAIPDTRFEPQPMPSFDHLLKPVFEKLRAHPDDMAATAARVVGDLPHPDTMPMASLYAYTTHRDPVLSIGAEFSIPNKPLNPADDHLHVHGWATIDPRTGAAIPDDALKIGSRWFYPMHYSLNWHWKNIGYYIVGLAAFVMLAALVTGVIMHRKIFRELFTFRPKKRTQRSALDLHNMTGVVALPFHFFFAFTGLVIFASFFYFPVSHTLLKPLHDQHEVLEAERTGLPHEAAGIAAPMASVDAMVAEAKRRWAARDMAGEVGYLFADHLGDQNGYVSIYRAGSDRVALVGEGIHFKASTGEVLREDPPRTVVSEINEFLTGLHLQHFEHWLLRWLYVIGGLLGCICIATGFIFFVEKRKQQHAKTQSQGSRIVDALAVTTVTGMLIASFAMLVANRLLPADLAGKGDWEINAFWFAWLLAFLHAAWRSAPVARAARNPAWREQCWIAALLAVAAVVLNWLTTGDHLVKTVFTHTYWPVAGVDLSLLATAALSVYAARKLKLREQPVANIAAQEADLELVGDMKHV
ncbi:PepSY-associated TM helix domain-containing protein [Cellvibrio sp. QJXJ]|uniref:PepSY-associated TM helix domain-containing protein n=1 Tax=Cellvibrio sp. QJXJ TaxID=2964606 RepID=UPI0021C264C7|nr:PepSY-associated TM helix domain-containing protein [Cellvibrio sp. QJXJ]UUA73436.1 PepSY domain-containing protein [Cellvibrio sp. QJXJ]